MQKALVPAQGGVWIGKLLALMVLVCSAAGTLGAQALEERDDGTTANLYEMQETAAGMDMVAGYDGAVVPGVRPDGCVILLQHSAGEHRDCIREEAVNVPTPTPEPVLDVGEPPEATGYEQASNVEVDATPIEEPLGGTLTVALTFYNCYGLGGGYCGAMSSGVGVYEGAAACGEGLPLGTRFSIVGEGRIYVCEDRGLGDYYWIDIFFWDYASGRAWRNQWPQSVEIELQS